jgi:hypothetical protein
MVAKKVKTARCAGVRGDSGKVVFLVGRKKNSMIKR